MSEENPADAPRLDGVRLLWDHDWWDGPVSGLAEHDGRHYWFEAAWDVGTDDWEHPRRYLLRELPTAELNEEWKWHRLFETHVSTMHCRHDGAPPGEMRPNSEWAKFYDAYGSRGPRRYDEQPIVGQFKLPPA